MASKQRIYFLINSLEGGGAERVITVVSAKLSQSYDVDIITLKNENFYELPEGVRHLPMSGIKSNLLMFMLLPYYVLKFRSILRENNYKSGMSSLEIANFVNILANRNAIISFEISIHFFVGFIGTLYKWLIRMLYPKAKKIRVNSEENRHDLAQFLGIPLVKISTVYNPIDLERIGKLRKEELSVEIKQLIEGKRVLVTVGRLVWQKCHEKIIRSLKAIHNKVDRNWVYLIVGDGEERGRLETMVSDFGLEGNVVFLGAQKNVFKYLNVADFFLYASKIEGFPNVLGEAMACDLPIVTSHFVSGAKECVAGDYETPIGSRYPYFGDNGVLLSFENYEQEFVSVYSHLDDLRQRKNGFEKFLIQNVVQDFESILNEGMDKSR